MRKIMLEGLVFVAMVLGALAFFDLLSGAPIIALASIAYVALTAAGYEITRRQSGKPSRRLP